MKLQRAINKLHKVPRINPGIVTRAFNGRISEEKLLLVEGVAVGKKYFHYTKGLRTRTR